MADVGWRIGLPLVIREEELDNFLIYTDPEGVIWHRDTSGDRS